MAQIVEAVTERPSVPMKPSARRPKDRRRIWSHWWFWLAVIAVVTVAVAVLARGAGRPRDIPAPPPAPAPRVARGEVQPLRQARIGTLTGGVVTQIAVELGEVVERQQPVARVRGGTGNELLTAPWKGTVTSVPVQRGDTVAPTTALVTIADLSHFRVETTDVDEFLVAGIWAGQAVTVTIDALDEREIAGTVRQVAGARWVAFRFRRCAGHGGAE